MAFDRMQNFMSQTQKKTKIIEITNFHISHFDHKQLIRAHVTNAAVTVQPVAYMKSTFVCCDHVIASKKLDYTDLNWHNATRVISRNMNSKRPNK